MTAASTGAALAARGAVLCELRRYDEAVAILESGLATDPENPRGWAQLGVAQLGRNDPEQALQAAERAVSLAPDAGWPLRVMSIALGQLGRIQEGIDAASRAVAAEPAEWRSYVQIANAQLLNRATDRAAEAAHRALALAPDEVAPYRQLAEIARVHGQFAAAEEYLRRALALDPTNADTQTKLALVKLGRFGGLRSSRFAASASEIARALGSDPRNGRLQHQLDRLLLAFLLTESFLVMLIASVVLGMLGDDTTIAARALPVALLAIPAISSGRAVHKLPRALRARLRARLRDHYVGAAVLLTLLAMIAIVVAAVTPVVVRTVAVAVAGGSATLAIVGLTRRLRVRSRPPAAALTLVWLAAMCWSTAFTIFSFARARPAGVVFGTAFAIVGLALTLRASWRRARTRR